MPRKRRVVDSESDSSDENDGQKSKSDNEGSDEEMDVEDSGGNPQAQDNSVDDAADVSAAQSQSNPASVIRKISRIQLASQNATSSQLVPSHMDYPKGSIIKMIFKDFLTYRHVVVTPGSRLNVLLGPNGTGKSSVICGICLTLGGTPRSLGRSEKINDYIRHGANEGSVELHLCDEAKPSGYTSVKATFRKNTTSFELDGQNSTQMEVKQLVKTYNIQVDNPVAFLAQDKVKSFSEQSPIELLKNTEKAGSPELLELHEKLIEKKKEELAYESAQNISTKNLSALEAQITNLRPKVDAYHQQVRLAEKIKLLEQRKAFLEYDEIVEEVDKQQEKVNEMRAKLTEKERQFNSGHLKTVQLKANIDSAYKMMADKRAQYKHLLSTSKFNPDSYKRELAEAKNNYTRVMNAVRDFDKGLERQKQNLENLGKELDKEQQTLHKMNYDESAFRAKRANFDRRDEELRKIDQELKIRIRKIEQERSGFTDAAYNYHQKIRERAESNLRGNAEQAFYWYQQHHNEFQHPIYIPAVHICTSSQLISRYIEQFVGNDDLLMFICGSKEDDDRLQRAAKQLGLRVNSTILLPENIGGMNVRISDDLRRLGFDNLLHELIDGPDPVKQYLFNVVKTQLIPIAFRPIGNLDGVVKQLQSLPYNRFIVEDLRVNITVSRYNRSNVSTQQSTIRPPRMLFRNHDKLPALHRDEKRINELHEEEMKARRAGEKMNEQRQKIQADRDKAYEENQQWKSIQNKIRELEGRIEIGKKTLEQSCSSTTRPTAKSAEEELNTAKEKIYEHLFDRLKHTVRNMETARANAVKIEIYQMQIDNLSALKRDVDLERVQKEGELADDKIRLKDQEGEFLKLEKNRQTKARTLYNTCRLGDTRVDKLNNDGEKKKHEAISKVFAANKLPDTVDEVNKQLQTELARQNIAGDSGTVQDVEKLKQLEDEKAALEDNQNKQKELRDKWSANMLKEVLSWRAPIEKIVSTINENYSKFFKELGCVGEVQLDVPENEMEIGSYGILIMVSFRSGERLKRLDNKVQSGGERSVSTMLYLLALQELCPVPFRCVDEINQGMDPTNERKVFDIMVDKLSSDVGHLGKSQYFLLTPKLLKGLKFNEKCTALVVENGAKLSNKITEVGTMNLAQKLDAVYGGIAPISAGGD